MGDRHTRAEKAEDASVDLVINIVNKVRERQDKVDGKLDQILEVGKAVRAEEVLQELEKVREEQGRIGNRLDGLDKRLEDLVEKMTAKYDEIEKASIERDGVVEGKLFGISGVLKAKAGIVVDPNADPLGDIRKLVDERETAIRREAADVDEGLLRDHEVLKARVDHMMTILEPRLAAHLDAQKVEADAVLDATIPEQKIVVMQTADAQAEQ